MSVQPETEALNRAAVSNLRLRLLSAAVGLPILGVLVWAGGLFMAIAVAAIAVLALHEAFGLLQRAGWRPLQAEGMAWGAAIALVVAFDSVLLWLTFLAGGLAVLLVALLRWRSACLGPWVFTVLAVVFISLPLAGAVALREAEAGLQWLLVPLLGAFATDTGAYAAGKRFGRRLMAPSVSPGKTWEGAAGGFFAGAGVTIGLVALLEPLAFVPWAVVALAVAVPVVGQAGDLLESKLKRLAGAKDSGRLIPGHGGLLDRMDSLVLLFPLVYYASRVWPS